jgi:hypothetical protein
VDYQSSQKYLRTRLSKILENAGLEVWPKLFVNLRASRRMELQEMFPDPVVNVWLGHSSRVAEKHYLQVTPEHWEKSAGSDVEIGGNIRNSSIAGFCLNFCRLPLTTISKDWADQMSESKF